MSFDALGENVLSIKPANLVLPIATLVLVMGLTNARQHNGKVGSVVEHDAATGRYTIQVGLDHQLQVKGDNVRAYI